MSEFCLSSSTKTQFSSLLLSDFMLFCSFILSHPLYFSYFIFFSPYLLKLLSFLSPLFITTSLLLLALLTGFPLSPQLPESKASFLLTTYNGVSERLRTKVDVENEGFLDHFEELEAYGIVFETSNSMFEARENPVEVCGLKSEGNGVRYLEENPVVKCSSHGGFGVGGSESLTSNLEENPWSVITQPMANGKRLEDFLQGVGESENISLEEMEVKPPGTESNKVEENKEEPLMGRGSKAMGNKISELVAKFSDDNVGEYNSKVTENSRRLGSNFVSTDIGGEYKLKVIENSQPLGPNLGSFGSMRKDKEWKRTLACKLFEERHNVDGVEGMDLLWETYETDSSKVQTKSKIKKGKKGGVEYYDDGDEEEEEEVNGQLCCLQALKFSAGKMNLGMGRPNLVRISKALKGIGWLHHVSSRHGKKGYN